MHATLARRLTRYCTVVCCLLSRESTRVSACILGDCVSLYNNAGLISKVSKETAIENAEHCRCRQLHCRLTPPSQGTTSNVRRNLMAQVRIYSKPGPVQKKCGAPGPLIQYLIYYFSDFRAISVCWHVAEIFFGPRVGASFLWGPLFGRTCWTCLNPPLCSQKLQSLSYVFGADSVGISFCERRIFLQYRAYRPCKVI